MKALPSPLCAVCDAETCDRAGWTVVDFASACLQGGALFLQIRAKSVSSRQLLDLAAAVVERARSTGAFVIVNDRADIARIAGAGGVHVGQNDLGPSAVRAIVGDDAAIGLSTHTPEQIAAAVHEPINYMAVGPVYGTATKDTGYKAVGLDGVRRAAAVGGTFGLPLVAIGGITLERAPEVVKAGAQAVAVISDLFSSGDPEVRVREYLSVLNS